MYGVVKWLVFQVVQGYSALGGSKYATCIYYPGHSIERFQAGGGGEVIISGLNNVWCSNLAGIPSGSRI